MVLFRFLSSSSTDLLFRFNLHVMNFKTSCKIFTQKKQFFQPIVNSESEITCVFLEGWLALVLVVRNGALELVRQ